jgi:hypothetical protein
VELLNLVGNIEFEEAELQMKDVKEGEDAKDDNTEGWIDEHRLMTEEEVAELYDSVAPVHLLLTKVC